MKRTHLLALAAHVALGGLFLQAPEARGDARGNALEQELALLQAPPTSVLSSRKDFLQGCKRVGAGPFQVCQIPASAPIARGVPQGGLHTYHVESSGTEVAFEAQISAPGYGLLAVVNGTRCPLANGITTCPVPTASGSELHVEIFPNVSGAANVRVGSLLAIQSIELRRGFTRVLEVLRARAEALDAALTDDLGNYRRFDKQIRSQSLGKADLQRIFEALTLFHVPPLPHYGKPRLVDGKPQEGPDGKPVLNLDCPDPETAADPDLRSHSPEECSHLAIVHGLLTNEPVFSQADIDATLQRLRENAVALSRIAHALAANGKALERRFQDLLERVRAKGIEVP